MRQLTIVSVFVLLFHTVGHPVAGTVNAASGIGGQSTRSQQVTEAEAILARFRDVRIKSLFEGATWTLVHDYEDLNHVKDVLSQSGAYLDAVVRCSRGDGARLSELGGIDGYKRKLVSWLRDDEQGVRAYAATMLGVVGDRGYAKEVAALLDRDRVGDAEDLVYDAGSAATALGLLGADEYTARLEGLLTSSNRYERAGAVTGLGWLGSRASADRVRELLEDGDEIVREAAKASLEMIDSRK